jgi:CheY-like chemotaxis protein
VLSAIVGYAELTRNSLADGSPARVNVECLLAATGRARMLVRRLLTFNPHRSVAYDAMPLQPVVIEVLQQMQATLPASIVVHTAGFELQPTIRGDATELHQVVMNLCTNAVRAMPEGGTLELRVAIQDIEGRRALNVGELSTGRWVCLSVVDSGVGLPADKLASIFEPFYTTRQAGQGSGIGLAVVRNVVVRMGGAVEVQSRVGEGTCMSVYWPLLASKAVPARNTQTEARQGGYGESVMVLDDEADLVNLTEEQLASLGYEPVGFRDPHVALAAFERQPGRFDAIVTDERMPGMRGAEFARRVHAIRPLLPVIIVTGHREADLDRRAREAGVAEILDKPLLVQALRAALERQLQHGFS